MLLKENYVTNIEPEVLCTVWNLLSQITGAFQAKVAFSKYVCQQLVFKSFIHSKNETVANTVKEHSCSNSVQINLYSILVCSIDILVWYIPLFLPSHSQGLHHVLNKSSCCFVMENCYVPVFGRYFKKRNFLPSYSLRKRIERHSKHFIMSLKSRVTE